MVAAAAILRTSDLLSVTGGLRFWEPLAKAVAKPAHKSFSTHVFVIAAVPCTTFGFKCNREFVIPEALPRLGNNTKGGKPQ